VDIYFPLSNKIASFRVLLVCAALKNAIKSKPEMVSEFFKKIGSQ
jgi:hypothetical protein